VDRAITAALSVCLSFCIYDCYDFWKRNWTKHNFKHVNDQFLIVYFAQFFSVS